MIFIIRYARTNSIRYARTQNITFALKHANILELQFILFRGIMRCYENVFYRL